ncbi:MAG TPA: hypothetical protein PLM22_02165 [Candidatus Sabulitectum sp.]|nr:hypothetical protein [Candidatus Sabulitectum sp.]HPJ27710.1 hypothetical protein [Candidatus Sabulitectum sp.]HPR22340.1 hypothetical protein [Candidatus Sabulitectum sp.]
MRFLKRLFGEKRGKRLSSTLRTFTFPENVRNPGAVGVFAPAEAGGVWSSLYMARALQESYRNTPVHLVIHRDYQEMAGFLPWKPEIHVYEGDHGSPSPEAPPDILLFSTEPDDGLSAYVEGTQPSACVSFREHPAVNIRVRMQNEPLPGAVNGMMSVLGLAGFGAWKPEAPSILSDKAAAILSPVSHRTLPYMLATEEAAGILEKKRAEIPLKLVITNGKNPGIPADTGPSLMAAIVAGSSAVITTERDLWLHGTALGIPVIALDRKGSFTGWDSEPATGETQFLEQWAALIRRGW